jgi:hypothetical protein
LTLPGHDVAVYSFDVASVVTAAGTYNFALTDPTAQSVASVFAREYGASGPRLVVQYGSGPLCGASFRSETPGETYQQALAREDGYYNGLDSARVFYSGFPDAWPGKLDTAGRPMTVSFKIKPQDVLTGSYDTQLRNWFQTAPLNQDIYWTYWHEPEDDIAGGAYTAAQYRSAWARIAGLADEAGNPRLHATLILMGWSVEPASGRDWHNYFPGTAYVEVLAWDVYNPSWKNGAYKAPVDLFAPELAANAEVGLPIAIAETGSPLITGDSGSGRAAWLRSMVAHLTANGAVFVQYFDIDWTTSTGERIDYRLRDTASMTAWREFCG